MPKIVYLDNLPAQEGISILENQNKIEVVKIESNNLEQSFKELKQLMLFKFQLLVMKYQKFFTLMKNFYQKHQI